VKLTILVTGLKMAKPICIKIYKTNTRIVIEKIISFLLKDENRHPLISDNDVFQRATSIIPSLPAGGRELY